jgi:signal transduction histidine kinase
VKLRIPAKMLSPIGAFVFCLLMTTITSLLAYQTAQMENRTRFDRAVGSFVNTLKNKMTAYTNSLIATRNLFHVKPNLSEKEFNLFVSEMGIKENFPGIQSMGYIEQVSEPHAKSTVKKMGLPLKRARFTPDESTVSLIRYSFNLQDTSISARGIDMGATEVRRVAMDKARDTGKLVASNSVVPLVSPDSGRSSFLIFVPIYKTLDDLKTVEERRDQLLGFVYGGFRSENLFGRLTKDLQFKNGNFFVQVFDGNDAIAENLMFSEGGEGAELSDIETVIPFSYADHTWSIRIVAPQAFMVPYSQWGPYMVFAIGFLMSLGIAMVLRHLEIARWEADTANQAKSMFLANISHEIRTPLGVMLGYAELASTQEVAADRELSLRKIIRNGRELTRILGDVLDVSKIEANMLKIETSQFSLRHLIEDLNSVWKPQIEGKGLEFDFKLSSEVPDEIRADQTRIKQILINLISNATKFTSEGKIRFEISLTNDLLRFAVQDSGIGISAENQIKLFKPFSQGDSSITRKFGGSGLGLALSREIAKAMGGTLELEQSSEGQGAVFALQIPFEKVLSGQCASTKDSPLPSLDGKRILLVEDSPDNRALVSMMLNRVNAKIETANDGADGVEKALRDNFDLVLMDIQMPIKDGYSAFRELSAKGFKKPIIALTAHALAEEKNKALEMGFADYLTKPVDYRALVEIAARFS